MPQSSRSHASVQWDLSKYCKIPVAGILQHTKMVAEPLSPCYANEVASYATATRRRSDFTKLSCIAVPAVSLLSKMWYSKDLQLDKRNPCETHFGTPILTRPSWLAPSSMAQAKANAKPMSNSKGKAGDCCIIVDKNMPVILATAANCRTLLSDVLQPVSNGASLMTLNMHPCPWSHICRHCLPR